MTNTFFYIFLVLSLEELSRIALFSQMLIENEDMTEDDIKDLLVPELMEEMLINKAEEQNVIGITCENDDSASQPLGKSDSIEVEMAEGTESKDAEPENAEPENAESEDAESEYSEPENAESEDSESESSESEDFEREGRMLRQSSDSTESEDTDNL